MGEDMNVGTTRPALTTSMFLLRTLPRVPPNPSDHSVLERIYTEMHAARFINLAPLSLLANSLGLYFKGAFFPATGSHLVTVRFRLACFVVVDG
jgi:hypothetical protein